MISQARFQSIRCLHDVQVDLGPLTVPVGPNGCGKSTLLDQIDNLCAMSQPDDTGLHAIGAAGAIIDARHLTQQHSRGTSPPMVWKGLTDKGLTFAVTVSSPLFPSWWSRTVVTATDATGAAE